MTWLIPLGLLGLLGIAALIVIYILKPKFQEKQVSTTFVWKLTLKYNKKKIPFQWLTGSIILIVQILMIGLIAFMMTHPIFISHASPNETIIILDASAHMMAHCDEGEIRFTRAIREIRDMADNASESSRMSLIIGNESPSFLVNRADSREAIVSALDTRVSPTFGTMDIDAAMYQAQTILELNPNAEVILFTARQFSDPGIVTIRDMSEGEWNAAILDFRYELNDGWFDFEARVASFNATADLSMRLYITDTAIYGNTLVERTRPVGTITRRLVENEETTVRWTGSSTQIHSFREARIVFVNPQHSYPIGSPNRYRVYDIGDSFGFDNEFVLISNEAERFHVQIISPRPDFLSAALIAIGGVEVTVAPMFPSGGDDDGTGTPIPDTGLTIDDFIVITSGFHLYIFDGVIPRSLPQDGVVWFFNPPGCIDVGDVRVNFAPTPLDTFASPHGQFIVPSSGGFEAHTQVLGSISHITNVFFSNPNPVLRPRTVEMMQVTEHSIGFQSLLHGEESFGGLIPYPPALLVRHGDDVQTVFVMPLNIENSNIHVTILPVLIRSMLNFSITQTTFETILYVGDSFVIHPRQNVSHLEITHPGALPQRVLAGTIPVVARVPGRILIEQYIPPILAPTPDNPNNMTASVIIRESVFVRVPIFESQFTESGGAIPIPTLGPGGSDENMPMAQNPVDIIFFLAIALIVFINVEWFLHFRELR